MNLSQLLDYLIPAAIIAGALLLGLLSRPMVFRLLSRWASHTHWKLDDFLIEAIRGPYLLWWLVLGLYIALQFLNGVIEKLPHKVLWAQLVTFVHPALLALLILSMTLALASFLGRAIRHYASRAEPTTPVPTLPQTLIRITVLVIGILIVLSILGIPITPILTALGIGGLAVALALQDTLSNLFAGFYLTIARQIRVGNYIQLESGQEGFAIDISWRTTTMRTLTNNLIIVPNAKLAQTIVTNFHLPDAVTRVDLPVGVSYRSDPEQIERVLLDEAKRAVGEVPGLLGHPEPVVRFTGFGDSALNFTLFCYVQDFSQRGLARHELHKRIFKRFRQEGIEIPFPIRTIYLQPPEPMTDEIHGLGERPVREEEPPVH